MEPYLLASTLLLIAAQRLIRVLCPDCRVPYKPPHDEIEKFIKESKINPLPDASKLMFYKAQGCPKCFNTGYKGRKAIYEIYFMSEEMKTIIYKDQDLVKLKEVAEKSGSWNLRASGWRKVLAGITSVEEMMSVTISEH
jgi:type II secretory ATPase GspE/PulE/Tfp pilus assembly ATPase PilB-like protein